MVRRLARMVAVALCVLSAAPAVTSATVDVPAVSKALASSEDFRVRVEAALKLGTSGNAAARKPLEGALDDVHPSVRQAAASALAKLGDALALPSLDVHIAKEKSASTKAAMVQAADELRASVSGTTKTAAPPDWKSTKYVVRMGKVTNSTTVRGAALAAVLEASARSKLAAIPGVYVVPNGPAGDAIAGTASKKGLPIVGVQASVVSLDASSFAGDLRIQAKVSLTVTKLESIKAAIEGNASTIGSSSVTKNPTSLAKLQDMAVDGAVSSAVAKAPTALKAAAGS